MIYDFNLGIAVGFFVGWFVKVVVDGVSEWFLKRGEEK